MKTLVIILALLLSGCGGSSMSKGSGTPVPPSTPAAQTCTTGNCWTFTLVDSLDTQLVAYTIQAPAKDNTSIVAMLDSGTVISATYSLPVTSMCNWVTAWPGWTFGFNSNDGVYGGYNIGQNSPTATAKTPSGTFDSATETSGTYRVYNMNDLTESAATICPGFPAQDTGTFTLVQTVGTMTGS